MQRTADQVADQRAVHIVPMLVTPQELTAALIPQEPGVVIPGRALKIGPSLVYRGDERRQTPPRIPGDAGQKTQDRLAGAQGVILPLTLGAEMWDQAQVIMRGAVQPGLGKAGQGLAAPGLQKSAHRLRLGQMFIIEQVRCGEVSVQGIYRIDQRRFGREWEMGGW